MKITPTSTHTIHTHWRCNLQFFVISKISMQCLCYVYIMLIVDIYLTNIASVACCCSPNIYERQPRTPGWIVAAESGDVEWHRNEDLWLGWRLFQTSDKFYLNIHWHSALRCWAGRQNFHNFPLLKLKQRSFDEVAILHNTRDETGLAAYLINAGTSILAQKLCW